MTSNKNSLKKGFREGGDSYYGEKGMMWWGAGVFIKPKTTLEDVINSPSESTDKQYVEKYFRSEEAQLRNQMEAVDTEDEAKYEDDHKWDKGHEYVCQEDGAEQWYEGSELEGERHHEQEGGQWVWNEGQNYGWDEESVQEVGGEGSEHETGGEENEHEVEDEGSDNEVGVRNVSMRWGVKEVSRAMVCLKIWV